jgi:poly(A)-specific ribonuclease
VANTYLPIQIGITGFEVNKSMTRVNMYPFNCFITPYFDNFLGANFACQESTIDFLCRHGMDYNKWLYEGVNYISLESEKKLNEQNLKQKIRREMSNSERETLTDYKLLYDNHRHVIDHMISSAQADRSKTWHAEVKISYMRPAVYKTLEESINRNNPDIYFTFTYDSDHLPKRTTLTVKAHSLDEADILKKEEVDKLLINPKDIELGGFRKVIELISDNEIPLVMHSGFMDSMFLYRTFVGELPLRQEDFKERFKYFFPIVYDTKILAHSQAKEGSSAKLRSNLSSCYERALLSQHSNPIASIDSEIFKYSLLMDNGRLPYHEAGFDSMATGYSFIKFDNFTELLQDKSNQFINKIYLHKLDKPFDLNSDQSTSKKRLPFTATLLAKDDKVWYIIKNRLKS